MKYIIKFEMILYFKFIIIIIVYKALFLSSSKRNENIEKKILLKIYNKLNNYKKIDISKMIFHILKYFNYYINEYFINLYITHLFYYIKYLKSYYMILMNENNEFDNDIIINNHDQSLIIILIMISYFIIIISMIIIISFTKTKEQLIFYLIYNIHNISIIINIFINYSC